MKLAPVILSVSKSSLHPLTGLDSLEFLSVLRPCKKVCESPVALGTPGVLRCARDDKREKINQDWFRAD